MSHFSLSLSDRASNLIQLFPIGVDCLYRGCYAFLGIAASGWSILAAGRDPLINDAADDCTFHATFILPNLYTGVMKVVNPEFSIGGESRLKTSGIVQRTISENILWHSALKYSSEQEFFSREVKSRITFCLYALSSVAARTADLALGIFCGMASLLFLGCVKKINQLAFEQLTFCGVVFDVCRGVRFVVNPAQCYNSRNGKIAGRRFI